MVDQSQLTGRVELQNVGGATSGINGALHAWRTVWFAFNFTWYRTISVLCVNLLWFFEDISIFEVLTTFWATLMQPW